MTDVDRNGMMTDNLPLIVDSPAGPKLLLRQIKHDRVSVIYIGNACWRNLIVQTADVVNDVVVYEVGQGESRDDSQESYDELLWRWFSHLAAVPVTGNDLVAFRPLGKHGTKARKYEQMVLCATTMLRRFENVHVVPWTEDVFETVSASDYAHCPYAPELPWAVDE